MNITVIDLIIKDDKFQIEIVDHEHKDVSMRFSVYQIVSWNLDSNNIIEKELYMKGNIKWDGCSHVWFGEEENGKSDGYLHLCGKEGWIQHCELMTKIFDLAKTHIEKYDIEVAE